MSVFFRVFAFLFLLFSQSVFAQIDKVYYKGLVSGVETCSESYQTFCDSSILPKSNPYNTYTFVDCGLYGYSDPQLHSIVSHPVYPDSSTEPNNITIASTYHKICKSGETLKLEGCTATCEVETNPCKAKQGQVESRNMQCGIASGTDCHWSDDSHMLIVCASHNTNYINLVGTHTSQGSCEMVIDAAIPAVDANSGAQDISSDSDPAGSMPVMCEVIMSYTGEKASADSVGLGTAPPVNTNKSVKSDTKTDTKTTPTGSTVKTTTTTTKNADGSTTTTKTTETTSPTGEKTTTTETTTKPASTSGTCPTGQIKNASGVCVAGGTGVTCPAGQTKNASGVCAADAACPAGQIKNVSGVCAAAGSYSGSNKCLTPPTCSGDVVQCGFILQQWRSTCDLQEALIGLKEGEANKYDQVGTNSNDARVTAATGALTQKVNDIKGFLVPPSAGSCPSDISITIMNKSIVLPISKLCPLFQLMRFLLHLIVNLLCLRILYSAFITV